MTHPLVIVDQRVLAAHVDFGQRKEHEPAWKLSYSLKGEDDSFHYLEAWLHGCSDDLVFSITLGALLEETGVPYDESEFEKILRDPYISSSLYSMARKSANTMLSLMDSDLELPSLMVFESISLLGDDEDESDGSEDDSQRPAIS